MCEATRLKKVCETRFSSSPERSSATIVLSNVGGSGFAATAATSSAWAAMPASNAGAKSPAVIRSNGGSS